MVKQTYDYFLCEYKKERGDGDAQHHLVAVGEGDVALHIMNGLGGYNHIYIRACIYIYIYIHIYIIMLLRPLHFRSAGGSKTQGRLWNEAWKKKARQRRYER